MGKMKGEWSNLVDAIDDGMTYEAAVEQYGDTLGVEVVDDAWDFVHGDRFDDSMDGDEASALASAGFGTDEDYGWFGDPANED